MKRATMCCSNRSSGVYPLNQGHIDVTATASKQVVLHPPPLTTSGLGTPLVATSRKVRDNRS